MKLIQAVENQLKNQVFIGKDLDKPCAKCGGIIFTMGWLSRCLSCGDGQ